METRNSKLVFLLFFIVGAIIFIGCTNDSGGDGKREECDGPVPCLTNDWGDMNYEFREMDGSPVIVISYGDVFGVGGDTEEGYIYGLAGPTKSCYDGTITDGGLDYNRDGVVDYWLKSASGNLNICDITLHLTDLVIEGEQKSNVTATYFGSFRSLGDREMIIGALDQIIRNFLQSDKEYRHTTENINSDW